MIEEIENPILILIVELGTRETYNIKQIKNETGQLVHLVPSKI